MELLMNRGMQWLAPLTGAAFAVATVGGFAAQGDVPDPTKASAAETVSFWSGNGTPSFVADVLVTLAALLAVCFGAHLRRVLREAHPDGGGDLLPVAALAGTVVFATGLALHNTIALTLTETADHIDPAAVQALSAFYTNDYVVFGIGLQLVLLATGLAVIRDGALPAWMGWVAVALAVIAVTPVGFVSFFGGLLLIAVISVVLALRARAPSSTGVTV
jgi:hypothetical protein